jgi:hypothetical protein
VPQDNVRFRTPLKSFIVHKKSHFSTQQFLNARGRAATGTIILIVVVYPARLKSAAEA